MVGTLCEAGKELKKFGAKRVWAFASHAVFSGPAIDRISQSIFEEVVVRWLPLKTFYRLVCHAESFDFCCRLGIGYCTDGH